MCRYASVLDRKKRAAQNRDPTGLTNPQHQNEHSNASNRVAIIGEQPPYGSQLLITPSPPFFCHSFRRGVGQENRLLRCRYASTTSADIIDAATGHCGGPSGFPREHAAARIFETSLAPGASTGITVSPYPRPGGWRRPNEHRRLRHAIAQPPSPRQSTPRRD